MWFKRMVRFEENDSEQVRNKISALSEYKPNIYPESLVTVLECIRLFDEGVTTSVIAQKMELDEKTIITWLNRRPLIEVQPGYRLDKSAGKGSWLSKKLASAVQHG